MVTTKQKRNVLFIFIIIFSLLVLEGCTTIGGSFKKAKRIDNIQAYEEFIRKYPKSPLAQQAKERIAELMKFSKALSEAKTVRVLVVTNHILTPTSACLSLEDMLSKIVSWTLEAGGYKVVGQEADEFDITFQFSCDRIVVYTPDPGGPGRFGPDEWELHGKLQVQLPGQTEVIVRHVVGPLAEAGSVKRLVVGPRKVGRSVYLRQVMLVQDILLILAELGNADRLIKIANSPYYARSVPLEESWLALWWPESIESTAREVLRLFKE